MMFYWTNPSLFSCVSVYPIQNDTNNTRPPGQTYNLLQGGLMVSVSQIRNFYDRHTCIFEHFFDIAWQWTWSGTPVRRLWCSGRGGKEVNTGQNRTNTTVHWRFYVSLAVISVNSHDWLITTWKQWSCKNDSFIRIAPYLACICHFIWKIYRWKDAMMKCRKDKKMSRYMYERWSAEVGLSVSRLIVIPYWRERPFIKQNRHKQKPRFIKHVISRLFAKYASFFTSSLSVSLFKHIKHILYLFYVTQIDVKLP